MVDKMSLTLDDPSVFEVELSMEWMVFQEEHNPQEDHPSWSSFLHDEAFSCSGGFNLKKQQSQQSNFGLLFVFLCESVVLLKDL